MQAKCRGNRRLGVRRICIQILLHYYYETLSKSLFMPSCCFARKEKISEIMNRELFVDWQVLNKHENTSGHINKISVVNSET